MEIAQISMVQMKLFQINASNEMSLFLNFEILRLAVRIWFEPIGGQQSELTDLFSVTTMTFGPVCHSVQIVPNY